MRPCHERITEKSKVLIVIAVVLLLPLFALFVYDCTTFAVRSKYPTAERCGESFIYNGSYYNGYFCRYKEWAEDSRLLNKNESIVEKNPGKHIENLMAQWLWQGYDNDPQNCVFTHYFFGDSATQCKADAVYPVFGVSEITELSVVRAAHSITDKDDIDRIVTAILGGVSLKTIAVAGEEEMFSEADYTINVYYKDFPLYQVLEFRNDKYVPTVAFDSDEEFTQLSYTRDDFESGRNRITYGEHTRTGVTETAAFYLQYNKEMISRYGSDFTVEIDSSGDDGTELTIGAKCKGWVDVTINSDKWHLTLAADYINPWRVTGCTQA